MQLHSERNFKSLDTGDVSGVELSKFSILTGPNGSGKSNLLEALEKGAVVFDDLGVLEHGQVRLFALGQLLTRTEDPVQPISFKEPWVGLYNSVQEWKSEAPGAFGYQHYTPEQLENLIEQNIIARKLLTPASLKRFKRDLGKGIADASLGDFQELAPLFLGVRDPFTASIAEVFLTYAARRTRHDFAKWRTEARGEVFPVTNEQFIARYGPPPWNLLTDTLAIVGLPYKFDPPPEDADQLEYEVALRSNGGDRINLDRSRVVT